MLLNEHPTNPPQQQKIRRLSCHEGSSGPVPGTDLSRLRSFNAFGVDLSLNDYRKQRLLRAINLQGCRNLLPLHPKSFSNSYLLKQLSLRNTGLSELPDSIGDLQNLEFLDIRETFISKLPKAIVKLQKLVYLLGNKFHKLRLPKGIGKLKKLRTFGTAFADNEQLLQEICGLVELQKLVITFGAYDSIALKGINVLLSKLSGNLRSLTIFHFTINGLKEAFDEVASPPLLLCKLGMNVRLGGLPRWFAHLNQVVQITLSGTSLPLEDVKVLRNLHTLVKLVLNMDSFNNRQTALVFDREGFAHLKSLEFKMQTVRFEEGALPSLEILKISIFYFRYSIDGLEHLHGLKEIHIHTEFEDKIEMVKNICSKPFKSSQMFCCNKPVS